MAYGLKYTGTLKDHFDRTVEVNVYELDFAGSDTTVTLSGISKKMNGSDNQLFQEIVGTSVSVGFLNETNFQFIDLYTGNARKYKLEIKIDSVVDWVGWIVPELFTEPYDAPPYVTQVTGRCGLAELGSLPFELTGISSHFGVLWNILSQITDGAPDLNLSVAIFEENHDLDESPLAQTYVDCERYEGMNCQEVVNDICLVYGARIYQSDGEFWFVNTVDFQNELDVVKYKGITVDKFTKDTELLIGRPQEDKFANTDQQLNILSAWKYQLLNIDLGKRDSFLKNWEFSDWTKTGYATPRNPIYEPDFWDGTADVRRSVSDKDFMFFTSNNSSPIYYRKQETEEGWAESDRSILFKMEYAIQQDTVAPQPFGEFWIKIEISGADGTRWLNNLGGWESTEALINIQNIPQTKDYEFKTFSVISDGIEVGGTMTVYIYASDSGNLGINYMRGEVLDLNREKYEDTFEYQNDVNVNNRYVANSVSLLTSDLQDVGNSTTTKSDGLINEKYVYKGGFFLGADKLNPTFNWQAKLAIDVDGFTNSKKLQYIVFDEKSKKTTLPQWALSGTILAKNIKIDSCIVDYQITSKKYLVCNGNYDMENCIYNGTYIEIGSWSGAEWILDGGEWNDDGIWIDTEVWEDS